MTQVAPRTPPPEPASAGQGRAATWGRPLPRFPVALQPPDLAPWRAGNTGTEGVWSFASGQAGPHVVVSALVHGNEIAGAITLSGLLQAGLRPLCGRLTFVLANLAAFETFSAADPIAARSLDEDMNRLWCRERLDGQHSTAELRRARELRPVLDTADILLDLHSMLWEGGPLLLCGAPEKARRLALALGAPGLVVADEGHVNGRRLIDYRPFADPGSKRTALLLEAGYHWHPETVVTMQDAVGRLLRMAGLIDAATQAAICPTPPPPEPVRLAQVTRTVTATTNSFAFTRPFASGEVIAERNTLIALDGEAEIRTPHDHCLMVMPALATQKGLTAVRLAKFVEA